MKREPAKDDFDRLVAVAYDELRRIARGALRGERHDHTLQPTALVHEAVLRLRGSTGGIDDRDAMMRAAVTAMRRVLIDHARARRAVKRGGENVRVGTDADWLTGRDLGDDVVELEDAMKRLELIDPRRAKVAEYRLFGGLENRLVADLLGIASSTASDDWAIARAWLAAALTDAEGGPDDRA